jgi:hypothetical protein
MRKVEAAGSSDLRRDVLELRARKALPYESVSIVDGKGSSLATMLMLKGERLEGFVIERVCWTHTECVFCQ